MTMTTENIPVAQPDGMMDEHWRDIVEGLACASGTLGNRMALRLWDNWKTTLTAAEQRNTLMQNNNTTITRQARQLEVIADRLLSEASERGWCSEYDDFVEGVNRELGAEVLKPCARNYSVTYSVSVTVTARGEDAAQEEADSELERALSSRGFEDYSYDCEGTELAS